MSSPSLPALFVLAELVDGAAATAPVPELEVATAQLLAINHRFVDASIDPHGDLLEALTDPDFLLTESDGSWQNRAHFLAKMRGQTVPGGALNEDLRVRLFGPVAVVHGVFAAAPPGEMSPKLRYTDVYVWSGTAWRLVSAQNTPLKDPGAVQLQEGTAPMPTPAPWRGQDPGGDDLSVLRALNENYVKAFRDADVAWYDAYLAPDYVVVSADGSFQDRAAALAHFARPTFATSIESFPVAEVKVRLFDDVALIHAENAYKLKDGRKGVSRYTDIWHTDIWRKQDGRWLCIAAHITVHKPPAM